MLRIILVLGFLVLGLIDQTCRGDTIQADDWRRQGFYRPRRNFYSQSRDDSNPTPNYQSQNNFRTNAHNPGTNFGQNSERLSGLNNKNHEIQNSFGLAPEQSFGSRILKNPDSNRRAFVANQNSQNKESVNSRNVFSNGQSPFQNGGRNFGSRLSQNLQVPDLSSSFSQQRFGSYNQNTSNPNSFRRFNQNNQPFGFGQKIQTQNNFGNPQNQNAFYNFGPPIQDYRAPGYLPPKPFKGPEYLPPHPKTTSSKPFYTTTKRPYFTTTRPPATRRQFYTTTTRIPYFTTTTTRQPDTTTPKRTTMTAKPLPAMAMPVPVPEDDDDVDLPETRRKYPTGDVSPALAMPVPPEPEDEDDIPEFRTTTPSTTTTSTPPPTTTTTPLTTTITTPTTLSTTTASTPPSTISTTPSTTTTSTTPSTTTPTSSTTTTTTPSITTSSTPSTTTTSTTPPPTTPTPSTTTTTTPSTTTSSTPSTTTTNTTPSITTITTPPTTETTPSTITTSTTPDLNRNRIEDEPTPNVTTSTTTLDIKTTTKKPYIGPGYLPPNNVTTTSTRKPQVFPPVAGGDPVPTESPCNPLDPRTWPTEYEQKRFGDLPCAPTTTVEPYSKPPGPAPAIAMEVPPEPKCDPLDPSTWPTDVDQREFGETPCAPTTPFTTTTTSTTPSTTLTTPSTTVTTPSTTVTTPSTTLTTPSTTVTTPSTTVTTPSTTVTTPSTTVTTPSTTVTTPSTTVTTPSTTVTTPSTTVTTPSTTVTTPSTTVTTPSTTLTTPSTTLTTPSTTLTTPSTTLTTPSTTLATTTPKRPYIAREYLPTTNTTALRIPVEVPFEPECDPLDPNSWPSEVDQREYGDKPCVTEATKKPYVGLSYLPPDDCIPKTRYRRSSNETLKLADLKGTPRPVWHVGIYKKITDPYFPICGGSIVRADIVISAAHCFWDDVVGLQSASLFAVAASKIYKPWKDPMDKKAQKSDVLEIKIPARFLGVKTSFQEDIAILKLATPFKYTRGVRPICVDFDDDFDRQQMKSGHQGTVAGWGLTDSKGTPTQRLLWLELPFIEIEKCIKESEDGFLKYITCDKVCAGENDTGKSLCKGDSGGGLAFWSGPASHATPYLRGIASTAPSPHNAECNVYAYGSFTHVRAHRTFLRDHVPDIESCRFWE